MANILNIESLTLNPQEVADFNKIIVKATLENPALKALHNVQKGVDMKTQIVLADKLGLTGLKSNGCERQSSGAQSTMTQKYWTPQMIEDNWEICQAELDNLFKAYFSKIESFKQMYNFEGTDEAEFVATLISKAASDNIYRAIYFGDTEVQAADADEAGLIDGTQTVYFDYFDGIFKQIFEGVTAGTIKRVDLSGITTATVSASEAYSAFMDVYKAAPGSLRSNPDAKFYVSGQMFLGLMEYLQTESVNFTLENTLEGFQTIKFLGKEVVNMEAIWDDSISLFVENTTDNKVLYPHRIIFSTPANMPVGTMNDEDFDNIEAFYDRKSRLNVISYGFTLDAKVLDENSIVVAY